MKAKTKIKELCKEEYHQFAKVSELVRKYDVSSKTIYRWRDSENWDDAIIEVAKQMYLEERQKLPEIAKHVRRSLQMIKSWKEEGRWDKEISIIGDIGLSREVNKQFKEAIQTAIKEQNLTEPGTVDKLTKLMKVVERLSPKRIQLANVFHLLKSLTEFVIKFGDDEFAKRFQKLLPDMADHLRNEYAD